MNNTELVNGLIAGEEIAYVYLVDKYHRRLYSYALTLVDNHVLAEDIIQNVFLKTWQFRKKLKAELSIQSFLYKLVYNEFVNTYRKDQSVLLLQKQYYDSLSEIMESVDENTLERMIASVTKEMEKLPPRCKQIFELSKKEGLTNLEISEYLNISPKTVETQITKAFKILRERLKDQYNAILFMVFGLRYSGTAN